VTDDDFCPWTPGSLQTPTPLDLAIFRNRVEFAAQAKYPIRANKELTFAQLSILRAAQLGDAAVFASGGAKILKPRNRLDRRPLSRDEVLDARARRIVDEIAGDDDEAPVW
jgi:hypothetical protein